MRIRSIDGLEVIASSHRPNRKALPPPSTECGIVWTSVVPKWPNWLHRLTVTAYRCGHSGPHSFRAMVYGEMSKRVVQKDYCPECYLEHIKKHTITCALCGLPIFPGEPIALYDPRSSDGIRADATKVDEAVVGCLRMQCCPTGGFFCGHWGMNGYEPISEAMFARS